MLGKLVSWGAPAVVGHLLVEEGAGFLELLEYEFGGGQLDFELFGALHNRFVLLRHHQDQLASLLSTSTATCDDILAYFRCETQFLSDIRFNIIITCRSTHSPHYNYHSSQVSSFWRPPSFPAPRVHLQATFQAPDRKCCASPKNGHFHLFPEQTAQRLPRIGPLKRKNWPRLFLLKTEFSKIAEEYLLYAIFAYTFPRKDPIKFALIGLRFNRIVSVRPTLFCCIMLLPCSEFLHELSDKNEGTGLMGDKGGGS